LNLWQGVVVLRLRKEYDRHIAVEYHLLVDLVGVVAKI